MCERIVMPDGSIAIVCARGSHRRKAPPKCHACKMAAVVRCDAPGCDCPCCPQHHYKAGGKDFCSTHAEAGTRAYAACQDEVIGKIADAPELAAHVREYGPVPMRVEQVLADGTALAKVMACRCGRPLDRHLCCWKCCDRPCRTGCGRWTGTAFVSLCYPCQRAEEVTDA